MKARKATSARAAGAQAASRRCESIGLKSHPQLTLKRAPQIQLPSDYTGKAMQATRSSGKGSQNSTCIAKNSSFTYTCSGCNKPIRRDKFLLKACDKYWHENCLKCDRCHGRLGELGSTLFFKSNMNLCRQDYLEMFGETGVCSVCEQLICASEMVMRAKQNVYHLECFACQLCNQRFCVGDRFYLCENKVVCQYDYEEHILPIQKSMFVQQQQQQQQTGIGGQPVTSGHYGIGQETIPDVDQVAQIETPLPFESIHSLTRANSDSAPPAAATTTSCVVNNSALNNEQSLEESCSRSLPASDKSPSQIDVGVSGSVCLLNQAGKHRYHHHHHHQQELLSEEVEDSRAKEGNSAEHSRKKKDVDDDDNNDDEEHNRADDGAQGSSTLEMLAVVGEERAAENQVAGRSAAREAPDSPKGEPSDQFDSSQAEYASE